MDYVVFFGLSLITPWVHNLVIIGIFWDLIVLPFATLIPLGWLTTNLGWLRCHCKQPNWRSLRSMGRILPNSNRSYRRSNAFNFYGFRYSLIPRFYKHHSMIQIIQMYFIPPGRQSSVIEEINHHGNTRELYAFSLLQCTLYRNVEATICRKFDNVLRMFRGSNLNQHPLCYVFTYWSFISYIF